MSWLWIVSINQNASVSHTPGMDVEKPIIARYPLVSYFKRSSKWTAMQMCFRCLTNLEMQHLIGVCGSSVCPRFMGERRRSLQSRVTAA